MAKIERFEDVEAWQWARTLRQAVYRLTRSKPFASDFALVDQIRRAAISAPSNIAEGFDRGGNREFIQFLSHANGSVALSFWRHVEIWRARVIAEVKDQLYCALNENYLTRGSPKAPRA